MAEATNTSQYSGGNVEVTYNTGAFGSNVISSGSATFERGPLIADASVYTTHFVQDVAMIDNVIQIFTFSDPAITSGRTTLGTSKIRLGTLTFNIEDCEADKGIAFDQFGTIDIGNHTHYTGSMPVPNENYDPVIADDTESGKVCGCSKPVITSFSPSTIHAGTGEVLTIYGENFGSWDENICTVLFKNGDDEGPTYMEAGAQDFQWDGVVHWSENLIQKLRFLQLIRRWEPNILPQLGNLKCEVCVLLQMTPLQAFKYHMQYITIGHHPFLQVKPTKLQFEKIVIQVYALDLLIICLRGCEMNSKMH